jgi:hypothetical protein
MPGRNSVPHPAAGEVLQGFYKAGENSSAGE